MTEESKNIHKISPKENLLKDIKIYFKNKDLDNILKEQFNTKKKKKIIYKGNITLACLDGN